MAVFTNLLAEKPLAGPAIATWRDPAIAGQIGGPAGVAQGLEQAAEAFAQTFLVGAILVCLTLIPALMLPRKREESHLLDDVEVDGPDQSAAPVVLH